MYVCMYDIEVQDLILNNNEIFICDNINYNFMNYWLSKFKNNQLTINHIFIKSVNYIKHYRLIFPNINMF